MGHGVQHWISALGLTDEDRFQIATPPVHILGLLNIFTGAAAGARFRLHPRFDLDASLRTVQDERLTLDQFAQRLTAIKGKNRTLIIRADKGIPYDTVMEVMNTGFKNDCSVVLATAEQPYHGPDDAR